MAQKLEVQYTCDWDEKDIAPDEAHYTRHWTVDGKNYEADYCQKHEEMFTRMVAKLPGRLVTRSRQNRTTVSRRQSASIRIWAKEQGLAVSERGRIPVHLVTQYDAVH